MLETLLGSDGTSPMVVVSNDHTPHTLQIHRQALQACNFVMGHLAEYRLRMEEVHRAQNIFCLRAPLLRSLQELGEWEDLVDGIEIGINALPFSHTGSVRSEKNTLDCLLQQAHLFGMSICDQKNSGTSPVNCFPRLRDDGSLIASVEKEGIGVHQSPEAPGLKILQPTLLLPEEALRLPLMLWPSTQGSLPSIADSAVSGDSRDDVWAERVKALTHAATSRLLRTWAMRVQDLLEAHPSTSSDQTPPAAVPDSVFHATKPVTVLANYLALSLSPTAMSYNDLGILLSSLDGQLKDSRSFRSGSPDETTGHRLSRLYFEAGLEVDPRNAHLLTNLGSYWKKEGNYEEAVRYVSPPLQVL